MKARVAVIVGAVALALIVIGGPLYMAINSDLKPEQKTPPREATTAAAKHFLDAYVDPDGRVVRRDQGNDTVSEGQAYAMLVAVAIGDKSRFESAWTWTKTNLIQPNGLMAWNWKDGSVVDSQPASDADLDAARALAVAARQFDEPRYGEDAKALAAAILQFETLDTAGSKTPVLLAGPWATEAPHYTNPSYHSPRTFDELAKLTGNARWNALNEAERTRTSALISPDRDTVRLPSDWARVDGNGTVVASSPPGKAEEPKYSFDAVRLPIRLAESCNSADREQARKIWSVLNRKEDTRTAAGLSLQGDVVDSTTTAVAAAASAAGAKAGGDSEQMYQLLNRADQIEKDHSTYYGSAWAALGRIMLTTDWLGVC